MERQAMTDLEQAAFDASAAALQAMSAQMKEAGAVIDGAKHTVLAQRRHIGRLERALEQIHGRLDAAIALAPSDDPKVCGHIAEADAIALRALRDDLEIQAPTQVVDMILRAVEDR
jgi:hypothetical protein